MSSSDIAPNEAAYVDDVQPERLRRTGWVRSLVLLIMLGEFLGLADIVSPPHKHILGLFGGSAPFLSSALLGFSDFSESASFAEGRRRRNNCRNWARMLSGEHSWISRAFAVQSSA